MQPEIPRDELAKLGPLLPLLGVWQGEAGEDDAPGDDRGHAISRYREVMTFTWLGRVDNHEQIMYGLKYEVTAWRLGAADAFHQEWGYWLWDAARQQLCRCFIIPRGMTVLAGGAVAPDATTFRLAAELGSPTYGICSNPFLDAQFKTTRFDMTLTIDGDTLAYDETAMLEMPGRPAFAHRDRNTLTRATARAA